MGQNDSIHYCEIGKPVVRFVDDSIDAIGMMFNSRGELYVCEGAAGRIAAYNVQTKANRILCSRDRRRRFNEPNDLAIDHEDGFYFSDPNYQHHGQPTMMKQDVYYCSAAGKVARFRPSATSRTACCCSPDDKTLYVADARGQRIYRYDVLGPGKLAGEEIWIYQLAANPDGLTLDEQGNLYICCGKAGLKVYGPDMTWLGTIGVHASNCCFGGPDFATLMITSVDKFLGIATRVTGIKPPPLQKSRLRPREVKRERGGGGQVHVFGERFSSAAALIRRKIGPVPGLRAQGLGGVCASLFGSPG